MLNPQGIAYLMFYHNGYTPITHIKTGIDPDMYKNIDKGEIFNKNYKIVTYENI